MKRLLAIALTMLMLLAACPLAASAKDLFAPYEGTVVLTVGRPSYLNELPDGGTLEDNTYLDFWKEYLNVEIHYDLVRTTADDYDTGDILDTYVYRIGLEGRKFNLGTAVRLFKSVIGLTLMLLVNGFSVKVLHRSVF